MSGDTTEPSSPLQAFLEQARRDRAGGALRPLRDYLEMFPGGGDVIAVEYLLLKQEGGGESETLRRNSETAAEGGLSAAGEADVEPGRRLGPYALGDELGRGGQGVVYDSIDTRLDRRVAVKVLRGVGGELESTIKRFRREAAVASRLDHPGICTVYDADMEGGVPYIAMRFVEGESLGQRIRQTQDSSIGTGSSSVGLPPLSEESSTGVEQVAPDEAIGALERIHRVIGVMEQTARALHVAHEAGVIHRDVKPANVMVTPAGQAVVMDFGLARAADADGTLTRMGDLFGTPSYMSPEQLNPRASPMDRRTDVWSLGVTLFECLTLSRPFDAPTREALYRAILYKDPVDPRRSNPSIPDDLAVVIDTALEKDPDRRYQTSLDLAEDLRRVRAFEPIRARPVTPWVRLRRWTQRNPGVAASITASFVILIAGLAVSTWLLFRAEAERRRADENATQLRKTAAVAQANLQDWERLADGRRMEDLHQEAEEKLWPAVPGLIPDLEHWLARSRSLLARGDDHRRALEDLRRRALPYDEAMREKDKKAHAADEARLSELVRAQAANQSALNGFREQAEKLQKHAGQDSAAARRAASRLREVGNAIAGLERTLERQARGRAAREASVEKRLTWEFEDPRDQLRQDKLAELVEGLAILEGEAHPRRVTVSGVKARLERARTLRSTTVDGHRSGWDAAIRAISESPRYRGLRLPEQVGLVPLGPDPESGLYEFAETVTGRVPERKDGALGVGAETGLVLVLLPGGPFSMGAARTRGETDANLDGQARPDEGPAHAVTLDPFFISKYEMNQAQWLRLAGVNPSTFFPPRRLGTSLINPAHPVERVTWAEATKMVARLGLVLPTEAQWEYAARGGTSTPSWCKKSDLVHSENLSDATMRRFAHIDNWPYESWDDGYAAHAPVGSFDANPFGLHDMLGNVSEWCRDAYVRYDKQPPAPGDGLRTKPFTKLRVYRGGSWRYESEYARSADRSNEAPANSLPSLGVRPVRRVHGLR